MEIRASKILVFDLDGQPQKHIPLAYITHKGRFVINDEKKTVTVMCIPFQGNSHRIDLDTGFRRQYHPRISGLRPIHVDPKHL